MQELATSKEDTQRGRYLTFEVGGESYGLPIGVVSEIVMMMPITTVPQVPDFVRGIINMRGKIIPVIDMRLRFKLPEQDWDDRTCIIVVDMAELSVGLIVDSVDEVVDIAEQDIVPPPTYSNGQSRYIEGIGKIAETVVLLLSVERLLEEDSPSPRPIADES